MYQIAISIDDIIVEMYIQSNVAISTGKVREFDVVCKVVTLCMFLVYILAIW